MRARRLATLILLFALAPLPARAATPAEAPRPSEIAARLIRAER